MNIGLIDVDSHNYPNLAQMKLSAWHKQNGDAVEWYDHMSASTNLKHYDIVYVSKVFDETYTQDIDYEPIADKVVYGGTGYGLTNTLPVEVEHIMPDYSLYGITDTAYGFLTRGCPRHCEFCIVGDKEGLTSHKVADLSEWWGGQKNIEVLDPNILACKERIDLLNQLADSKAVVNINQGMDIRLMTPEVAEVLKRIRLSKIHFAWDNPTDDLKDKFQMWAELSGKKPSHGNIGTVYCLVNFNSTMEENLYRIYTLRDMGYAPYVMVYDKPNAPKEVKRLQRWCNNRFIFYKTPKFEDYK